MVAGTVAILPTGIDTTSLYGAHTIAIGAVTLVVNGISSTYASGNHIANTSYSIYQSSINSDEAYGTHTTTLGAVNLIVSGIAHESEYGTHSLFGDAVYLLPATIQSEETIPSPYILISGTVMYPPSVVFDGAIGNPNIYSIAYIAPGSIGSTLNLGNVSLKMPTIPAQMTSKLVLLPCTTSHRSVTVISSTETVPMVRSTVDFI
jgi:hypothetical protein